MPLLARLLCLLGQHRRSRGHARRGDTGWQSRCRGCGARMEKRDGETWRLAAAKTPEKTPAKTIITPKPEAPAPDVARDRPPKPAAGRFATASARMQRFVRRF